MRRTHCRQAIVERSSLYFWSIWEQHVFSFIIVHLQTKIYEVLKRASVHLAAVVHYWTGTTTNSTSLVLKKVRIKMFYTRNLAVKSSAEDVIRLHSPSIRLELPACRGKGGKKSLLSSFQWETKKKEFSYLYNGGRRFFTGSGAPLCYSNRSPSIRTTTEVHPLILAVIFFFAVTLDEDPTQLPMVAVCVLLVLSVLLKSCINLLDKEIFTS